MVPLGLQAVDRDYSLALFSPTVVDRFSHNSILKLLLKRTDEVSLTTLDHLPNLDLSACVSLIVGKLAFESFYCLLKLLLLLCALSLKAL